MPTPRSGSAARTRGATPYGRAGRREDARRLLAELEKRAETDYVPGTALAYAHLGLGDPERALSSLETAYRERAISLVRLEVDWRFAALRSDSRYQDLLRRMNFPS
jgi:hypothetical protein